MFIGCRVGVGLGVGVGVAVAVGVIVGGSVSVRMGVALGLDAIAPEEAAAAFTPLSAPERLQPAAIRIRVNPRDSTVKVLFGINFLPINRIIFIMVWLACILTNLQAAQIILL